MMVAAGVQLSYNSWARIQGRILPREHTVQAFEDVEDDCDCGWLTDDDNWFLLVDPTCQMSKMRQREESFRTDWLRTVLEYDCVEETLLLLLSYYY